MASAIGTRQSPRFIANLCNGTTVPQATHEQMAILLFLTCCTGWAADQIANKFAEVTGIALSAAEVWDHHWSWVDGRNEGEEMSEAEWDIMQVLLKNIGVELDKPERALSETARPTTIEFAKRWSAKIPEVILLFPGYTTDCREASKAFLLMQKPNAFGELTPPEALVLAKFGDNVLYIFKRTLKSWARAMLSKVQEDPGLRPIREREHVDIIMEYLREFQIAWEDRFGKMEMGKTASGFGEVRNNTVFVKSIGYGVKVVLGLLMADRTHVVEKKRKMEREFIGFMEVKAGALGHDSMICPICQDSMGRETPDGATEKPLRLVICCGQLIGKNCLHQWLGELVWKNVFRDTCPICRFKFPESFLKKLFSEDYAGRVAKKKGELGLASPNLEFEPRINRVLRSQHEQDAILHGEFGVGGDDLEFSDGERELSDVETAMEQLTSPLGIDMSGVMRQMNTVVDSPSHQVELGYRVEDEVKDHDQFDMEG